MPADQRLLVRHGASLQAEARQLLARQPAHEHRAPPLCEAVARVDHQSRRGDRGHPVVHGRLHPLALGAHVDPRSAPVVDPVAHDRPAVVPARQDQVDLVSALRAVLVEPEVAGLGMEREALRVAVAVAVDVLERALGSDERIVGGDAPVVVQAHDHAVVGGEVLRRVGRQFGEPATRRHLPVPGGDVEVAFRVECQARAVVVAARRAGDPDLLDVDERVVLQAPPHHARARSSAFARPGVAEVEQAIRLEIGVQGHVQQAALAPCDHLGHAPDGLIEERSVTHDAQPSRPLGDEHVSAGEPGEGPRIAQALDHGDHLMGDLLVLDASHGGSGSHRLAVGRRGGGGAAGPQDESDRRGSSDGACRGRGAGGAWGLFGHGASSETAPSRAAGGAQEPGISL